MTTQPDGTGRGGGRPAAGVFRDPYGIPHLRADSVDALARLQGANAATDRAWQLEHARLRSVGEIAAWLGTPLAVSWDVLARRARIADTARRCFERLDERTRTWLDAYVDGVNAALPAGAARAPEFAALGLSPGRWEPWTPLAVFLTQHLLFATFADKLWQVHVSAVLGPQALELFLIDNPYAAGSNAYGITGAHTASGFPLIGGDPHRNLDLPGTYQQVRLSCPEFDVLGFAFPGVPGLPHFGHGGEVAWSITNAMADYQDLYLEDLERDAEGIRARGPAGWERCARSVEQVAVRGGEPVEVEIIETARGPVILGGPEQLSYSLRTVARAELRIGFEALLPLLHARTADDVSAAFDAWVEPVNAVVIADRSGRVLNRLAGAVPVRPVGAMLVPVPAWESEWSWSGLAAMPQAEVTDLAVNANDAVTGAGLGVDYASSARADRITELLAGRTGLTADDIALVHVDGYASLVEVARPFLVATGGLGRVADRPTDDGLSAAAEDPAQAPDPLSPEAEAVRAELLAWDGRMDAESRGALLFAAWRSAFVRAVAGQPAMAGIAETPSVPPVIQSWLLAASRIGYAWVALLRQGGDVGLDVPTAVRDALTAVAASPPPGTWGDAHRLAPLYPLDGIPGMPQHGVAGVRLSGDRDCVLSTASIPGVSDWCTFGPVARYVWDLGDRDQSRWLVPYGASGVIGDPHFADQLPLWADGRLVPVVTDWSQLTFESADPAPSGSA